jgi:hypothetical protein
MLLAAVIHRSLAHAAMCVVAPDGRFSICSAVVSDVLTEGLGNHYECVPAEIPHAAGLLHRGMFVGRVRDHSHGVIAVIRVSSRWREQPLLFASPVSGR